MTVTILIFAKDSRDVEKVKRAVEEPLIKEFGKQKVRSTKVFQAKSYGNFAIKITIDLTELGSIPIPQGFYDKPLEKPAIVLKEAKGDASDR